MVAMNKIEFTTSVIEGRVQRTPITHAHMLTCKKAAPSFPKGETDKCYITKYDGGRFAVFTISGVKKSKYHVFESAQELHDHFDENPQY